MDEFYTRILLAAVLFAALTTTCAYSLAVWIESKTKNSTRYMGRTGIALGIIFILLLALMRYALAPNAHAMTLVCLLAAAVAPPIGAFMVAWAWGVYSIPWPVILAGSCFICLRFPPPEDKLGYRAMGDIVLVLCTLCSSTIATLLGAFLGAKTRNGTPNN